MNRTTGERIKALRVKKGWSQDQLAEALGVNRANVSNYERDIIKAIPADALMKMSDLFKVSVDFILGKSEDDTAPATQFVGSLELSDEEILSKFSVTVDGKPISKAEAKQIIAFLRLSRQ